MFKSYKFFLPLATSIFLLFADLSFSIAEIYKWEDYSKPFMRKTEGFFHFSPIQIDVLLPDFLKSHESVTVIVKIDVNTTFPGSPYFIVNNFNREPYRISKFNQDSLIAIKSKHLRTGINSFSFRNDSVNNAWATYLEELRFDIPNMGKIDPNITKKIESEKSNAEIYKWEDYSKPFMRKTEGFFHFSPIQIDVLLPDFLKSHEGVTVIVKIDVDTTFPGSPYFIVNNFNREPYRISKFNQDSLIAIKSKHLRTGINSFSFRNDSVNNAWATYLEELRFDIPNMGKIDTDITKKIASNKINKLPPLPTKEIDTNEEKLGEIGTRWAVVIGISSYQDSRIPYLRYASKDAQSFYNWLISPTGGQYAPARVRLLIDDQATGERIKKSLFEWLNQVLEEDIVTIFFAGHGSPQSPDNPENLFLLPYDVQYDSIAATGFPMWDIETALKRFIKATRVIVIADACHAGGVGQAFDAARRDGRGLKVVPISSNLHNLSHIGDGICILTASDDDQFSQESKKWGGGHGVFTYYLLKGLNGHADYNKDRSVSLGEIIPYLSEQVRRETKNAQTPTVAGRFDPALTIGK